MAQMPNWTPRPLPTAAILEGRWARLERLDPTRHGDQLFEAAMAPGAEARFRYLFETVPRDRQEFDEWCSVAATSQDPLFYVVIDRRTGHTEGRQTFLRITPQHGVFEIGSIQWGPRMVRTRLATEALFLFAQHAFDDLGYRRFEWKCDAANIPSRQAALRFGFSFEGIFLQHMVIKGMSRDTAWFAMIDADWPRIKAGYERWLDEANFDEAGNQKIKLSDALKSC